MKVTLEFLHANSSHPSGQGWTKKQLSILGVDWPPRKGWIDDVVEIELTDEQAAEFISMRHRPKMGVSRL